MNEQSSLVVQLVKHLPAMLETQIQSLGQEDSLEKEVATHSSVLAWKNPMDRGVWWTAIHRVAKESGTTEHVSNNSVE